MKPAPKATEAEFLQFTLRKVESFVRNGSTRFVLVVDDHMPVVGVRRGQTLLIEAEACSDEVCVALCEADPKDELMLEYAEQQDRGRAVRLYNEARVRRRGTY